MANELIAAAISEHYGERCPDFDADCFCCKAWAEYDALTRPAAPVDGLDTFGRVDETGDSFILEHEFQNAVCFSRDDPFDVFTRELVTRSQAEAIIAAKYREVEAAMVIYRAERKWRAELEADNAALTARVKELEADVSAYILSAEDQDKRRKALETQLAAARKALKTIADAPAWGFPEKWETTPAEVRQLARAALEAKP